MKKLLFALIFLQIQVGYSQNSSFEIEKLVTLGKVWGFLKYHHPTVTKGKLNWDAELFSKIRQIDTIKNKEIYNAFIMQWLAELGEVKSRKTMENDTISNRAIDWINKSEMLSNNSKQMLKQIRNYRIIGKQYYVRKFPLIGFTTYKAEKKYADLKFPNEEIRLLCLFRYWNIINYFYPYVSLTDQKWDSVLDELVLDFKNAKDTDNYVSAIRKLVIKTDDGHNGFSIFNIEKEDTYFFAPFEYAFIEQKIIVTHVYQDSLSKLNNIKVGDIITKMEDTPILSKVKELLEQVNGSNFEFKESKVWPYLLGSRTKNITLQIQRNDSFFLTNISKCTINYLRVLMNSDYTILDSLISNDIAYINLKKLQPKQVKTLMAKYKSTKGMIIDIRNYPNGVWPKLAQYLNKEKKEFAVFKAANLNNPGTFINSKLNKKWLSITYAGSNNKNFYKGKVVLLVNSQTISHSEFTCMALQTAPNVLIIGSKTAGADGNVTEIPLPGGYTTYMSSLGVYYPDGRETQRIGIIPNIYVKQTIKGVKSGKDEILHRAIEYVKTLPMNK